MSDAAIAMRETTKPKPSKTGAEAKENYERMKAATDEMTGMVEASYSSAVKGARDYGLKVIDITRANASAAFDLCGKLVTVKSPSEAIELSTAHARQQFDGVDLYGG
jgi:phasin